MILKHAMPEKVYIVIVNYNNWPDTIECLKSIFNNLYRDYQAIVVDNGSTDDSAEKIAIWAKANIPCVLYTKEDIERNANSDKDEKIESKNETDGFIAGKYPLILIRANDNLGFGAGNNLGMKYALSKDDFDYIWLLNNDAVCDKNALVVFVEKAREYAKDNRKVGIIGSKVLFYDRPGIIQTIGYRHNRISAKVDIIGGFSQDKGQFDRDDIKMDYVYGASMFVTRDFVKDIGLMSEEYFLYYEELDWCTRARQKGWDVGFCYKSKIFHKQGVSTGNRAIINQKNLRNKYYFYKNLLKFYKKFYKALLPFAYLRLMIISIKKIISGQLKEAFLIVKIILGK